jgi:hypothetical protein
MDELLTEALKDAIQKTHGCASSFLESVPTEESFQGRVVWSGTVEVFELLGHPTAKKCYAWRFVDADTHKPVSVAVLHVPPIDTPQKAVKAFIVNQIKTGKLK